MLKECPECTLQVSDKAVSCPHCGYPLQAEFKPKPQRKSSKRMRLPNGFGQISEIKNQKLRKPFRAMVTVGKSETGRPICKPLQPESYFSTYNEAYAALVEYNRNPYDLSQSITIKELHDRWFTEYEKLSRSDGRKRGLSSAWKYIEPLYDMQVREIRIHHIKKCIENASRQINGKNREASANMKNMIKIVFNLMLDYAVEYELVDKNYSRMFELTEDVKKEATTAKNAHIAFTDEEMEILWQHSNSITCADMVLIQCYSGWRPNELCTLKVDNVNLKDGYFTGGSKTDAGKDRIVPIHSKIRPLVEQYYEESRRLQSDYLFHNSRNTPMSYCSYKNYFQALTTKLELNNTHRLHDCRVHFITLAKKYNVDEYAIKYIVGHSISDLTEKVYTKRDPAWLKTEIEKIK